jgi:hypothetical protein
MRYRQRRLSFAHAFGAKSKASGVEKILMPIKIMQWRNEDKG